MKPVKLSDIYSIFGKKCPFEDLIDNISTDSRKIGSGDFFVPIKGDNFDGHNFLSDCFNKGAVAALCSDSYDFINSDRVIKVPDTLDGYHKIASYYRSMFNIPVVAITGSNGKTTTKDLLHSVMSLKYKTVKTTANHNNEIGVPQTILSLDSSSEALVIELGMRGKGQIKQLRDIVKPNLGIITMVGESHFELLGSFQAIADAKAELIDGFSAQETVILNSDDKWTEYIANKAKCKVLLFGMKENSDLRLISYESLDSGSSNICIELNGTIYKTEIVLPGIHNIYNSLAVILAGFLNGISVEEAVKAINKSHITGKRMDILKLISGITVIDDCYNASPASMRSALLYLKKISRGANTAILGDMKELGIISEMEHLEIGKTITELKINRLITVGELGKYIAEGAKKSGMPESNIFSFESLDDIKSISLLIRENETVLVKASRAMAFEKIIEEILSQHPVKENVL